MALVLVSLAGCRSPEAARQAADRDARRLIAQGQRDILGAARAFEVTRPADTLRRRLMREQNLPSSTHTAAAPTADIPFRLSFVDALQVGARNNNEYQDLKEDVFRAALDLDLQQYAFDTTFAGLLDGAVESDTTGLEDETTARAGFTAGMRRTFRNGATVAANLALDVVQLLSGDRDSSFGVLLDTTITVPLLRGAGRAIVTEPLTQAERDLWYALLALERYRRTYTVQVARDYLAVLQAREQTTIVEDNLRLLETNLARAEHLARAGRLLGVELDQTRQDVLRARNRRITARQRVDAARDRLKLTLGLPADAHITLDPTILERLAGQMDDRMNDPDAAASRPMAEAVRTALEQRLDLAVVLYAVEDARRKTVVAANALRTGVDLELTGSTAERSAGGDAGTDASFGDGVYAAGLEIDLPWNRRQERNAYRNAFIGLDRARRALEAKEDEVKQAVRDALRDLAEAREAYEIQTLAVKLAEQRVQSTAMFLESGRAQTRDLLEAQEAQVNARSALTDALVAYYSAYWGLLRGTGELRVNPAGVWNIELQESAANP